MTEQPQRIGQYLLLGKLGQGGMGIVYRATQGELGREVALKVLPEEKLARGPEALRRFNKEVSVCARLSHPNIVKIYDYGYEAGVYYYAMELLRATSLEERLQAEPVPPLDFTMKVARDLLAAFAYYHPMGIVHRDLKPANLMMDESGKAILTDFGLVKELGATAITRAGSAVGTPYYMAPEMIRGRQIDARADLWQFGVILYRMTTGQFPFAAPTSPEVLMRVLHAEPQVPTAFNSKLSPGLETVILNCLEKDPALRYRDATELATDFDAIRKRSGAVQRRASSSRLEQPEPNAPVAPSPAPDVPSPQVIAGPSGVRPASGRAAVATSARPDRPSMRAPAARVPEPPSSWKRLALPVAAMPLLLGLAWLLGWGRDYSPADVRVRVGLRRASVEWRSPAAYAASVEWALVEAGPAATVRRSGPEAVASQQHGVTLEPLTPGAEYRLGILLPGGKRVSETRFQVPAHALEPVALEVADGRLALEFTTPSPTIARLQAGTLSDAAKVPTVRHRLTLKGWRPGSGPASLTLTDGAGDPVRLEGKQLVELLGRALLPRLAVRLAEHLERLDVSRLLAALVDRHLPSSVCTGAWSSIARTDLSALLVGDKPPEVSYYVPFPAGDPLAARLAGALRDRLRLEPYQQDLEALSFLGPAVFEDRTASPETLETVLATLRKLRDIDYYCAFVAVPYSTGVEQLFRSEFRPGYTAHLGKKAACTEERLSMKAAWAHPMKEFRTLLGAGFSAAGVIPVDRHEWHPVLPQTSTWKRAELSLISVKLDSELVFRVTVNRRVVLDFRHEPNKALGKRASILPVLAMQVDPRIFHAGPNDLVVELVATPGSRGLGFKKNMRLGGLRLAWD
ncbi:MAG: protein kinase [Candidatus Riflebacteria bacterium]|nr:protein kinase [Candidatus Riflebacteria bacterium]